MSEYIRRYMFELVHEWDKQPFHLMMNASYIKHARQTEKLVDWLFD